MAGVELQKKSRLEFETAFLQGLLEWN